MSFLSNVSDDTLRNIFSFFLAEKLPMPDGTEAPNETRTVDSGSVLACMLVCKRWKNIVYSKDLWGILTTVSTSSLKHQLFLEDRNHGGLTLVGLVKQKILQASHGKYTYIAFHLGSQRNIELHIDSVSHEETVVQLLKECFVGRFIQGDSHEFSSLKGEELLVPVGFVSENFFFPGASSASIKKRFAWWYWVDKEGKSKRLSESLQIDTDRCFALMNQMSPLNFSAASEDSCIERVRHLLRLEDKLGIPALHHRVRYRASVVDWIVEVASVFNLADKIIFLSMAYFDRSSNLFQVSDMQYHAGCCLYMAAKISAAKLTEQDIAMSSDCPNAKAGVYSAAAQELLLPMYRFDLALPTIYDFVTEYCHASGVIPGTKLYWMARYLSEHALQSAIQCRPSQIAVAVLVLARYALGFSEVWPGALENVSPYELSDLNGCIIDLSVYCEEFSDSGNVEELAAISYKYLSSQRGMVRHVQIPSPISFSELIAPNECS
jgi:hypothetical protein